MEDFGSADEMVETGRLCWFCGLLREPRLLVRGGCIGNMVYSSPVFASADGELENDRVQMVEDAAYICEPCVEMLSLSFVRIEEDYAKAMEMNLEAVHEEVANFDTGLDSLEERSYAFGCWFAGYPNVGAKDKFYSMPLIALFHRGFRFKAILKFRKRELQAFIKRFTDEYTDYGGQLFDEFTTHVSEVLKIIADDSVDVPLLKDFASIRACIFDISVYYISKKEVPRSWMFG